MREELETDRSFLVPAPALQLGVSAVAVTSLGSVTQGSGSSVS